MKRNELDRLLARGRLSGPERDEIWREIEPRVQRQSLRRAKYFLVAGPIGLAAAVALLLRTSPQKSLDYSAKGTGLGSTIEIGCSGGELTACPRGSKLIFRFEGLKDPVFVQAYAESIDKSHERVWYFPAAANPAPRFTPDAGVKSLAQGVVIGSEHGAGHYRIHVVLTTTPRGREELLLAVPPDAVASQTVELTVVER